MARLGRSVLALAVVVVLFALGAANIAMRMRWHEVEDGVLWDAPAEGVTAKEVAAGSAGGRAGHRIWRCAVAVNGQPVEAPADVLESIIEPTKDAAWRIRWCASARARH